MLKINVRNTFLKRSWNLSLAIEMIDTWEGTLLYSSEDFEGKHKNILGINPIFTYSSKHFKLTEIDEVIKYNKLSFPWLLGFINYDAKGIFEEQGVYTNLRDTEFPDFAFHVYQFVFIFDQHWNLKNSYELTVGKPQNTLVKIDEIDSLLVSEPIDFQAKIINSSPNKNQYKEGVNRIKQYIETGDVYQVNLTRKISCKFEGSESSAAKALLKSNHIEFGVFYKSEGRYLISTSPERFFQVERNKILTSPIKGTAGRSVDDEQVKTTLLNDTKNLRELAMITDLLRNDISRICKQGTVIVKAFPILKTLNNVFHLVADIEGELHEKRFSKIMQALFPGGSITGCPKIRACQIIEELEQKGRGVYTGSFGYISHEQMDFNILIRTVFIENNQLFFNVGGGITLLSDAQDEYEETQHKARNIISALRIKE